MPIFSTLTLVAVMVLSALLLGACLPEGVQLPQSPLLRRLERKSGWIAYLGADGNIYTIDQGGGNRLALTSDAQLAGDEAGNRHFYQFPSWSRAERRLAFVGVNTSPEKIEQVSLYNAQAEGGQPLEIFTSREDFPFYLYWSPDGKQLAFLATNNLGSLLTLWRVPAAGGEAELLETGAPLYWDWSPDNQAILAHVGGAAVSDPNARLTMLAFAGGGRSDRLEMRPAFFLAPAWSPAGDRVAVAVETEEGGDAFLLADRQGTVGQTLAHVLGNVSFSWSPDGKRLAYLTEDQPFQGGTNKTLTVLDQKDEVLSKIEAQVIVGYFWAPDGKQIAYFIPDRESDDNQASQEQQATPPGMEVRLLNVRSGETRHIATVFPSEQFIELLPYFDQYQRSVTIWSPDSRNLVLSAYNSDGTPGIFVVEVSGSLEPRYLTEGVLAFWSWK